MVATKTKPSSNAVTKVCVLKRLPDKISKAREIADRIKSAEQDYEDDEVAVKIHPYSKLIADTTDWHRLISFSDLKLIDFSEKVLSSEKLIPLSSFAEAQECDLRHYKFKDFHGFILKDARRIQRKTDHWFLDRIKNDLLIVRHRKLMHIVEIPTNFLVRALRRFSYINTIDVTDNSDYLILNWFDKIREMARYAISSKELNTLNEEIVESWKRKFEKKKAHLLLARRLYLSSPGTCLIAFYSKEPTIGIDLWSLRNINAEDAKILALWLNSSLNILQLLYIGVACEGPWMKLHDYMLNRLLIPNPEKLTKKEREKLLKIFEEIRDASLPSITEQLRQTNSIRKTIDKTFFEIVGYKDITDEFLENLYTSILNEIELIGKLMSLEKKQ